MYSSPLTLPGELIDIPELPPDAFLRKVNRAIDGFPVSSPHHVRPVQPVQLPAALVSAKYVFVREDAVISSLAPRYRGPYLVIDRQDKYFCLQIGSKQDVVSVDRLKPVFSDAPLYSCSSSAWRKTQPSSSGKFFGSSAILCRKNTQESQVSFHSSNSSSPCTCISKSLQDFKG